MLAAAALSLTVAFGAGLPPPMPLAVAVVPDEPGAFMLPERPTYQAVVADLDGNGSRDVVRLVLADRGAIVAEVWRHGSGGWGRIGPDLQVIPPLTAGSQANLIFARTPARMIVRAVGDRDHVTVVRQPRRGEPGIEPECCLLLHDIVLDEGVPKLHGVAPATNAVDAVLALDLDGDGTDELLATRSLPPLGRTAFPSEALLYRWERESFRPPTLTKLPIGSGDTPFVLGDSDGHPGVEAAVIGTAARGVLYRLALDEGDRIRADDSRLVATAATAVPLGDGRRGIAVVGPLIGLAVHAWPSREAPEPPEGILPLSRGRLIGVIDFRGTPVLAFAEPPSHALHLLILPRLVPPVGASVTRSPAAGRLASGQLRPYVGFLPGGGPDGSPLLLNEGRVLPTADPPDARVPVEAALAAMLPGVEPVGLAGPDRAWVALLHGIGPVPALDPSGGRLDAPTFRTTSGLSIAPFATVRVPEEEGALLEPPIFGALPTSERRMLVVGATGFETEIVAPPGSRIHIKDVDPSLIGDTRVVPESGLLRVPLPPPPTTAPNARYRVSLTVVTPAGRGYVAAFEARTLTDPPPLAAHAETPIGSTAVEIRGTTAAWASVTVDGRPMDVDATGAFRARVELPPWPTEVTVRATDPLGNEAAVAITGIGLLDYRGLPWIPIAIALVAGVAALFYLRVPRPTTPISRRADDDGVLEELDPD